MPRFYAAAAAISLAMVGWGCGPFAIPSEPKAVADCEKCGGWVEKGSHQSIVGVNVANTKITDAGLVYLEGLTKLRTLNLSRTEVTDAGLECVRGLTELNSLDLGYTKVTGAGLERLKGLRDLQSLNLTTPGDRRRAGMPQRIDQPSIAGPAGNQSYGCREWNTSRT